MPANITNAKSVHSTSETRAKFLVFLTTARSSAKRGDEGAASGSAARRNAMYQIGTKRVVQDASTYSIPWCKSSFVPAVWYRFGVTPG